MNYVFGAAAIAFTGGERVSEKLVADRSYDPYPGIGAAELRRRLEDLLAEHAWETTLVQFNLLSSHTSEDLSGLIANYFSRR